MRPRYAEMKAIGGKRQKRMSMENPDTGTSRPDPAGGKPPTIPYEPPAIAWEEPFQVTVAASCALFPLDGTCTPRPAT